ncbi:MAG: 50S ribosomal protein L16 [Patescibacteria group bacterium]
MLFPKKVKHRKWFSMRRNPKRGGMETRGVKVSFGSYGLKALSSGRVRSNQIESSRKVLTRGVGKIGKFWIRIFPDFPYTQKAAEVGMGQGKGEPQGYQFEVFPGRILFEVDGLSKLEASETLRKAGAKLPVKTKVVGREGKSD